MQGSFITNNYSSMKQYVVKQNDSLYMIAKAHNVSIEELKQVNHLVSNTIYPNQILFIPVRGANDGRTYMTSNGESINDILVKFNLTFAEFAEYNDIEKLKLEGNQLVYIVTKSTNKYHVVSQGEKIEDILAKYQLSPLDFLKLNENNFLVSGEKVIIE